MRNISFIKLSLLVSVMVLICGLAAAQTTVFPFQGKLPNSMTPANGSFEMEFKLFDAAAGGNQIGATVSLSNVEVKTGSFSVQLDFGAAAFSGADRFIEIGVRRQGDAEPFQVIAQRAQILSVPYAIRALSAATADALSENCEECITDAQIQSVDGSKVTGTVANAVNAQNAANVANAANADTLDNIDSSAFVQTNTTAFIRNQTAQQAADFNINGTGKANIFDVATQYNIDGFRILSAPTGTANLYAGFAAGNNPGTGTRNSAFGYYAGESTNSGGDNSFFGHFSGRFTVGSRNSFFGTSTGYNTRGGDDNTFVGGNAGLGNTVGSNNTLLGSGANVLSPDLNFATAIGAGATVNRNNQIVLGRSDGQDEVVMPGNTSVTRDFSAATIITSALTVNGSLSVDIVNAATQFNLGGNRILANNGAHSNFFAGVNAGISNNGRANAFFGDAAGQNNNSGGDNSFFGMRAGFYNQSGSFNSFFGAGAGSGNSLFSSSHNSFFGYIAGMNITTGTNNSFFGTHSGHTNSTGSNNSFFGESTGVFAFNGNYVSLFGARSGGSAELTNATAIGSKAFVTQSNSLVLGSISEINGCFAIENCHSVNVGIGTTAPSFKLQVIDTSNTGLRVQTNATGGTVASFGGNGEFSVDAPGVSGGRLRITEAGSVGIGGTVYPDSKLTVSGTGIVRSTVNSDSNSGFKLSLNNSAKWSVATVGSGQFQIFNETNGQNAFWITPNENLVGIGTTTPTARLDVRGTFTGLNVQTADPNGIIAQFGPQGSFQIDSNGIIGGRFRVTNNGIVQINNPPNSPIPLGDNETRLVVNGGIRAVVPPGVGAPMCWEGFTQLILQCGISSIRYKKNVQSFMPGLDLVRRLRPISFDWKKEGIKDFGLIAEEVAEVEPLLNYYDAKGEVQGVKYDRLGVVLVNAVKEQQQIIERQQQQIDALKKLVCQANPGAEICKEEQK